MADDLDRIGAEAAAAEAADLAAMPLAPGEEPAAAPVDPAQEWVDLARFGADLITAPVPELKADWTAGRVEAFGQALARCADHYGWTTGGVLGHPLAGLALASWPLAVPVWKLAQARKKPPQVGAVDPSAPLADQAAAVERAAGIPIVLGA